MPRVTQASIGIITFKTAMDVDVSAITTGTDNLQPTISTVAWTGEHSLNPQDTIGVGERQFSDGKTSGTLTISGYPSDTGGFQQEVRDNNGKMKIGAFEIFMTYGGPAGVLKQLLAIAKMISINNSVDAEGNATVETSWQSVGDDGILET